VCIVWPKGRMVGNLGGFGPSGMKVGSAGRGVGPMKGV
jgi:hypothetical protein